MCRVSATEASLSEAVGMISTGSHKYPGQKLDLEDGFRLVEVQPGEQDDPVVVRLLTSSLHGCPSYEALSYAWGDVTQTEPIQVVSVASHGESCPITPLFVTINCAAALKRLRPLAEPRTLWIDAICINQSLVSERNHQLSLMPRIYGEASRVVVYLGESSGTDGSDAAMGWLREIHEPSDSSIARPGPASVAVRSLLGRQWFKRTWVLQEIRVARDVLVVCGDIHVSWKAFEQLRNSFDNDMQAEPLPFAVQSLTPRCQIPRQIWTPPYAVRLLKLLQNTRCLGATDARDKIYAILPLLDWEDRQRRWMVEAENKDHASFAVPKGDYSRSPTQVYIQVAQDLINTLGLNVLRSVVTPLKLPGLPSWAPDWSTRGLRSFRGRTPPMQHEGWTMREAYASSKLIATMTMDNPGTKLWRFSNYTTSEGEQSTQLYIRAARAGTIVKMGDLCDIYHDYLPLEQWESLCEAAHLQETPTVDEDGTKTIQYMQLEKLSPFVKALFGPKMVYACVMMDALGAVRKFNREGSTGRRISSAAGQADDSDGKILLRNIFAYLCPSEKAQAEDLFFTCHGRRFFITDTGFLGLAPEAAVAGNQVVVIKGLDVPFVARLVGVNDDGASSIHLVGQCHAKEALGSMVEYEEAVIR